MELHKNYSLLTHQSITLPTYIPINNIKTFYQLENLCICQHPVHPLTPLALHHNSHTLLTTKKIYRNSSHHLKLLIVETDSITEYLPHIPSITNYQSNFSSPVIPYSGYKPR